MIDTIYVYGQGKKSRQKTTIIQNLIYIYDDIL